MKANNLGSLQIVIGALFVVIVILDIIPGSSSGWGDFLGKNITNILIALFAICTGLYNLQQKK